MELMDKFTSITKKHDDAMFEIFKSIIDKAKKEAEEQRLDSIYTFVYVNEKLQNAFRKLALVKGVVSDEKNYTEALSSHILSESLLERIYTYLYSIIKDTRNGIRKLCEDILDSTSLKELQERYDRLLSVLSMREIQANEYLYEGIEFTKKKE